MYLSRQGCITLSSILNEGLYNLGFPSRSRFEAHTVVEGETWILIGAVLAGDVGFSSTIMSDIYQWPPSTVLAEMIFKNCSTYLILVGRFAIEDNVPV
jgi:hypothetical protein